mmetsp:Transcript_5681/g.17452  ORF Transcript_5681/g.17452 Transcript_5681/m.17452 type:complete len:210 (+) Transcript_5681:688-1317(+)
MLAVRLQCRFARCACTAFCSNMPVRMKPALRKTTCTSFSPTAASMAAIHAPLASERFASTCTTLRRGNCAASSRLAASKSGSLRATRMTSSPCPSSVRASSLPMPEEEPVTSAQLAPYFLRRSCRPSTSGTTEFSTTYTTGANSSTDSSTLAHGTSAIRPARTSDAATASSTADGGAGGGGGGSERPHARRAAESGCIDAPAVRRRREI